MKKKRTFMSVKFRSIFVAATFTMLAEYVLTLTDKIIVGQLLGDAVLPALTLIEPLTLLVAFIASLLAAGVSMQISAALGRGDQATADRQLSQALILAVGAGALITAVYVAFARQIIEALAGNRPEARYAAEYFRFIRHLPVPMLLSGALYPAVLYRGGEKFCNYSAAISVAGNIALSVVLAAVMGVGGVGLATVIGNWCGIFPLIYFFFTDKGRTKFSFHLSLRDIRSMGAYSLGNSAIYLYMAVFQACMNAFLLARFGASGIVAFMGVSNLTGLYAVLTDGLGEFLLSMLNMYRGERNVIGERNTMLTLLRACLFESLAAMLVILLFAGAMPLLFGVEDAGVRRDFVAAVRIYALCTPAFCMICLYTKYYLCIGKIRLSLVLGLCLNLLFPLVFGLPGGLTLGMTGVWIGMAAALPLLFVCAYPLIRRQKGADALCMFIERDRMACQYCWNAGMTGEGIAFLMDSAESVMLEKGISRSRINQVLLAIEETQMEDMLRNTEAAGVLVECTLFLEEKITLVLRNTGISHNATEPCADPSEELLIRGRILSGMKNKSYILVNGSNRLIFEF